MLQEANPGNPALCLQLSNPANLAPGQTPCGPFSESNVFITAGGQTINGTRGPLGPNFGSDTLETTIGNSHYNSLQVTLRHTSGPLQLLAAYTSVSYTHLINAAALRPGRAEEGARIPRETHQHAGDCRGENGKIVDRSPAHRDTSVSLAWGSVKRRPAPAVLTFPAAAGQTSRCVAVHPADSSV